MRQIGGGLVLPVRTVGSGLQLVTVNDFTIGLDNGAVAATVRFPADALPGQVFAVTRRTRISQGVVTIDDIVNIIKEGTLIFGFTKYDICFCISLGKIIF